MSLSGSAGQCLPKIKPVLRNRTMPSPCIPLHLLPIHPARSPMFASTRPLSTSTSYKIDRPGKDGESLSGPPLSPSPCAAPHKTLPHLTPTGAAHMVSITEKVPTARRARASCTVYFSNPDPLRLIRDNSNKKGDVLGVARIAGIMAAKRVPDIIPLCHPVMLTHVSVDLDVPEDGDGKDRVEVSATVSCHGKTGVEMEALTAASAAALTVYDMCKAVDKGMRVEGLRVVLKEGGKSGRWEEGMRTDE